MNDDKDKLAAEARDKMRQYFGKPMLGPDSNADPVLAIIKTACEKAYSQGWHEGVRQCARKQQIEKERAAATSAT